MLKGQTHQSSSRGSVCISVPAWKIVRLLAVGRAFWKNASALRSLSCGSKVRILRRFYAIIVRISLHSIKMELIQFTPNSPQAKIKSGSLLHCSKFHPTPKGYAKLKPRTKFAKLKIQHEHVNGRKDASRSVTQRKDAASRGWHSFVVWLLRVSSIRAGFGFAS